VRGLAQHEKRELASAAAAHADGRL